MTHSIRKGNVQAGYVMNYAVGSGRNGKEYLHRVGDALFQSPLAWYAGRSIWDMAPGFFIDAAVDFYRPVTGECLQCHAGEARHVAGTRNRYEEPAVTEMGIGCGACHGDLAAHLKEPGKGNVVNPAKLAAARRDSVCESCHFTGQARVANPGKTFADFRPGMQMEEVFSVYVSRKSSADTILRTYTQAEQMAASRCATESAGKLWCGSCHNGHAEPSEKERAGYYRERCLNCHKGEEVQAHRKRRGEDCAGCHMPRRRPWEGTHTAMTDHWIRTKESESKFMDRGERLRAWREPAADLAGRNLALAYLESAEKTRSAIRLREGLALLETTAKAGRIDGEVALAAGRQMLNQKRFGDAVVWLKGAVEDEPKNSMRRVYYAAALANTGQMEAARAQAEEAIRIEPMLEEAYSLLAQMEPKRAEYWRDQYRKLAPMRLTP